MHKENDGLIILALFGKRERELIKKGLITQDVWLKYNETKTSHGLHGMVTLQCAWHYAYYQTFPVFLSSLYFFFSFGIWWLTPANCSPSSPSVSNGKVQFNLKGKSYSGRPLFKIIRPSGKTSNRLWLTSPILTPTKISTNCPDNNDILKILFQHRKLKSKIRQLF